MKLLIFFSSGITDAETDSECDGEKVAAASSNPIMLQPREENDDIGEGPDDSFIQIPPNRPVQTPTVSTQSTSQEVDRLLADLFPGTSISDDDEDPDVTIIAEAPPTPDMPKASAQLPGQSPSTPGPYTRGKKPSC